MAPPEMLYVIPSAIAFAASVLSACTLRRVYSRESRMARHHHEMAALDYRIHAAQVRTIDALAQRQSRPDLAWCVDCGPLPDEKCQFHRTQSTLRWAAWWSGIGP